MRARELMPPGMGIAGVDVSGLNREAAAARVTEQYFFSHLFDTQNRKRSDQSGRCWIYY